MDDESKLRHPKASAFAACIAGYQEFYEPIVRAWFADHGLPSIEPRSVGGKDLLPSLASLQVATPGFALPAAAAEWALRELQRKSNDKRCRVQLDLLLQAEAGVITGECKSWGGYLSSVTWSFVEQTFVAGKDGLFLYLTEVRGQPVVESKLVLWKRSHEHDEIKARLSAIFHRPIRLHYIDEIMGSLGPKGRAEVNERLRLLDDATGLVKQMLEPAAPAVEIVPERMVAK
jgi:hypothetical protein